MVFCINAVVAYHFKVPVRDMYDQTIDKVNGRDTFRDGFMILMVLIMERHIIPVIGINPGSGNDRSSKVAADIFNGDIRRPQVRFGSNIKAFGMVFVNLVFKFLKRRSQFKGELLQKDFTDRRRKR